MPLLKRCAEGNLKEIEFILRQNRSRRNKLRIRDNHNWTCLHHAVKSGSVECVKFLLTFNELNTIAETFEGETVGSYESNLTKTALHIACAIPNISLEIVSLLIEANADLVNFVNNEEVDLLQCAIRGDRLDIVKILLNNGAPVNHEDLDGDTALHIAVIELKLEIVLYLLVEAQVDATICNSKGFTACYLLFTKLLQKLYHNSTLSREEIDCFDQMVQLTYSLQDMSNPNEIDVGINQMILLGYRFKQARSCLYTSISRLFSMPPSKQYFLEKILNADVPSCHCLVSALVNINVNTLDPMFEMWCNLLAELFFLCFKDESFFDEYISEIMSSGWNSTLHGQVPYFCEFLRQRQNSSQPRILFHFLKTLILYEFDFEVLMRCCELLLPPAIIVTVFVPLAKVVRPCYPLKFNHFLECNYNFNESGDMLSDQIRWKDRNRCHEVVSLKNMCRMKIRSYYFKTYSHYTALKALYNLNIPVSVREFVCYNINKFKF